MTIITGAKRRAPPSNMPSLVAMPMVSAPDGVLFRFLTDGRLKRGMPS